MFMYLENIVPTCQMYSLDYAIMWCHLNGAAVQITNHELDVNVDMLSRLTQPKS